VVYTALIGGYERLNDQPVAADSGVDFVCFTDDETLESDTWQIRVVAPRFPLDPVRSARFLKTRGTELLTDYDESLWIDNTVLLTATPDVILDDWLADADLALPRHSLRRSVLAEFEAVATFGYDDAARVYEQIIHYTQLDERALHEVPYWTALLARRHTPAVREVMQQWYEHILRYSRRDQLSVNLVLRASDVVPRVLEFDNAESDVHRWPIHSDRKWSVTRDRLGSALRVPLVELGERDNEIRVLTEQLDAERLRTAEVEREYQNSFSWRLTAPIRAVRDRLRG
jgi:hypothetical protein